MISRRAVVRPCLMVPILFIFPLLFFLIVLSNNQKGAILAIAIFFILFFFPGYLLVSFLGASKGVLRILLGPAIGIAMVTTAYDLFAHISTAAYFPYGLLAVAAAGIFVFVMHVRRRAQSPDWTESDCDVLFVGTVAALMVAPLYWRSGRFSGGEFVFYGPAGQDPLFHVTLLQRLSHHVPPDNFIFSGLRAPVYHYFDDLALALMAHSQTALHLGKVDVFDLYYRCYPTFLYFLLGALAYGVGRRLVGTKTGGILGILLFLGGGGLGWMLGILQTLSHASQLSAMRASFFSSWTNWDGVDAILPLVHRPAHYHGLLICLAALIVLLHPERSRRDWTVAGLLLGLMAGFNFTLTATTGFATVLAALILVAQHRRHEAGNLAWLALLIFICSLPVTASMLFSGLHNPAAGFPFRGPNLEFTAAMWGPLLGRFMLPSLIPWAALIIFPIFAYGIKLFGVRAMTCLDLGEERHRGIALVLAIVFVISLVVGTFFPYNGLGGIAVIFIQPTLWILGLFSLRPIHSWLERNRGRLWPFVLWGVLGVTWLQALASFNFSSKAVFPKATAQLLREIRTVAAPDEVVAYLPSSLSQRAILGQSGESTNFAITALTGLDGYFASETYSTSFAVPGLRGRPAEVLAGAKYLYQQRHADVEAYIKGESDGEAYTRLTRDRVCWIVVAGDVLKGVSHSVTPWRTTQDLTVFGLCRQKNDD